MSASTTNPLGLSDEVAIVWDVDPYELDYVRSRGHRAHDPPPTSTGSESGGPFAIPSLGGGLPLVAGFAKPCDPLADFSSDALRLEAEGP